MDRDYFEDYTVGEKLISPGRTITGDGPRPFFRLYRGLASSAYQRGVRQEYPLR